MRHLHTKALLLYTALALLFTWPLARQFTTHMPGNGIDDPSLGWNLWWIKSRLVDQLQVDIFHADWLFHPIQINLAFYTLTPLNGLISVPLQTAFGLIVANNLVLLSSFVLSGYGVFLLVRNELAEFGKGRVKHGELTCNARTTNDQAPFFAGIVYAFAANKLFYAALGQYNIASSHWIPFCVLYLLRLGRSPTRASALRNAALAGLFLVFQTWAELTYASFLLLFIAIYFCWLLIVRLRVQRTWEQLPATITPFLLVALIFLLGLSPFLWAMLPDLRAEGNFFTSGGGFSDTFSADLAGYLVPTRLHWLLGDWVSKLPFASEVGQQVYVGYTAAVLAILGLIIAIRQRWARSFPIPHSGVPTGPRIPHPSCFWLLTTLIFWWLTLGPRVRWLGQETAIPGPFALLSLLPFFNGNRYPSRYSVMVLLGVAVLAGIGYWRLEKRNWGLPHRSQSRFPNALFTLAVLCFTAEHLALPLPLNNFHVPEIYQKLAAAPGDFAVLELPTGWRNGARVLGKSDKLIMMQQWYQTVHGKRRLGGNTSRNPPYKFQYFTQAPLLSDLIGLMNADPNAQALESQALAAAMLPTLETIIQRDRQIAAQVLDLLDVRYVMVHVEKATPALLRFVAEALPVTLIDTWQGIDWEGAPSTIQLYQVKSLPAASNWEVDVATAAGNLYLGEGWSSVVGPVGSARYAIRPNAELLLNLPDEGGRLELGLTGMQSSTFAMSVNGRALNPATWQWLDQSCLSKPNSSQPTNDGGGSTLEVEQWRIPCRLAVTLPAQAVRAGLDRLALHFAPTNSEVTNLARALAPNQPAAEFSLHLPPGHTLVVQSAGKDVGDFAHIYWDGVDVARQQRGYNLVALVPDPAAAADYVVRESTVFDTLSAPEQSAALATWLRQWPAGTLIAGAVQDEASLHLGQDAVDALATLGVTTDLRGKFRGSHAFITAVGADAGATREQASLLHPATVYLGAPVEGPQVYGGVGRIRFTAIIP